MLVVLFFFAAPFGHGNSGPRVVCSRSRLGPSAGHMMGFFKRRKEQLTRAAKSAPHSAALKVQGPSNVQRRTPSNNQTLRRIVDVIGLGPILVFLLLRSKLGAMETLPSRPSSLQCKLTPGCQGPRIWARSRLWAGRSLDLVRKADKQAVGVTHMDVTTDKRPISAIVLGPSRVSRGVFECHCGAITAVTGAGEKISD